MFPKASYRISPVCAWALDVVATTLPWASIWWNDVTPAFVNSEIPGV
ncbi:MAG TPA: hypothetical protein VGM51_12915 [Armatimonadota bacterium]